MQSDNIIMMTATAESVVTSSTGSNNVVLGAILGVIISGVLVLVTSSFIVVLVTKFHLRAQGWL